MKTFNVHSKKNTYEIILHDNLNEVLTNFINSENRYFIIIDNKLVSKLETTLKKVAPNSIIYPIEGGETAKSFEQYEKVVEELLNNNISKTDFLIGIGGGTILDLTGYVASTYKRGISFISVPTTTLAMVDASIGGKNAINVNGLKNAIGTIYPPEKVLMGLDVLSSLEEKDFNNGLFEALKTGLILDKTLFDLFLIGNIKENLGSIIEKSIQAKINVVEEDEDEKGKRMILNFGHTFGHALEGLYNFNLKHGEAIANGMLIVSKNKPYYEQLKTILLNMNCPILNEFDKGSVVAAIKNDKKVKNGLINYVIVDKIGEAKIISTTFDELERML